jgi:hypothetical protein
MATSRPDLEGALADAPAESARHQLKCRRTRQGPASTARVPPVFAGASGFFPAKQAHQVRIVVFEAANRAGSGGELLTNWAQRGDALH